MTLGTGPLGASPLAASATQPANQYVLSAEPGAFVLLGEQDQIDYFDLAAEAGTFSAVGASAQLDYFDLTENPNNFALVGFPAVLAHNYGLSGSPAALALTGNPVAIHDDYMPDDLPGAFTLQGVVQLAYDRIVLLQPGSIGLTIQAGVHRGYTLAEQPGEYSLTLDPATAQPGYAPVMLPGRFGVAGNAAMLRATRALTGSSILFVLKGSIEAPYVKRQLSAAFGGFLLNGKPLAPARSHVLSGSPAVITLSGKSRTLARLATFSVPKGTFTLQGSPAGATRSRVLTLSHGTIGLDYGMVSGELSFAFTGTPAVFALSGSPLGFGRETVAQLQAGTFNLLPQLADLIYSGTQVPPWLRSMQDVDPLPPYAPPDPANGMYCETGAFTLSMGAPPATTYTQGAAPSPLRIEDFMLDYVLPFDEPPQPANGMDCETGAFAIETMVAA